MSGANFNGLVLIYREDVLRKVKGCEFHYNQSVEKKAQSLQVKKDKFKELASLLGTSTTVKVYSHAYII